MNNLDLKYFEAKINKDYRCRFCSNNLSFNKCTHYQSYMDEIEKSVNFDKKCEYFELNIYEVLKAIK